MIPDGLLHGGRLEAARRRYPGAPQPFIDLSTGINPVPYPVPGLPETCFTRLPEPEALWRLQEAAADAYGAPDPAMVVAAPGTQALIALLPRLRPPCRVHVLAPTYGEHAPAWSACGHAMREVAAFDALEDADVAVLCNPNNPDGRRYPGAALAGLAGRLAARGGLALVDEAFADLEPDVESLAGCLPQPGILVLRSFGKTYGLAGVRLGFLLADAGTARAVRAALGPWAVSGIAIEIGCRALVDRAWREAAARRLRADARRLADLLASAGLEPVGGTRLFQLCETGNAPAAADQLGHAGILVRAFPGQRTRLRFGIPGDEAAWARLGAALASLSV